MSNCCSIIIIAALLSLGSCTDTYRAESFNRDAASPESRAPDVIRLLDIAKGGIIADIGAGGGYFTLEFAKKTGPSGLVYAVDVNDAYLGYIRERARAEGLGNIRTVRAGKNDAGLPAGSIDLVFVRHVYHHLPKQAEYFRNMKRVLKKGGRVAIIELKPGGLLMKLHGHYTPADEIKKVMMQAGYTAAREHGILSEESFLVFDPR